MLILRLPQACRSSSRQPLLRSMRPCRWINALMRDATSGTLRRGASSTPVPRQVPSITLRPMGEYINDLPKKHIGVEPENMPSRGLCEMFAGSSGKDLPDTYRASCRNVSVTQGGVFTERSMEQ